MQLSAWCSTFLQCCQEIEIPGLGIFERDGLGADFCFAERSLTHKMSNDQVCDAEFVGNVTRKISLTKLIK
ncbi:hypothetical protein HMPREF9104_02633 [Lentilactobacillus kisonensis F0435]|uniref:Uncharacterized protein n=1 Tax=Lentilactobacillus kisonensis F0435 TaxID=797516 RepID=H1LJ41_9LACO|nr:hypothetical protein HMPREF9104_02633 [Lentilactobacillus kisonensis F0435]